MILHCIWLFDGDHYVTECGYRHRDADKFAFCPYCGKAITMPKIRSEKKSAPGEAPASTSSGTPLHPATTPVYPAASPEMCHGYTRPPHPVFPLPYTESPYLLEHHWGLHPSMLEPSMPLAGNTDTATPDESGHTHSGKAVGAPGAPAGMMLEDHSSGAQKGGRSDGGLPPEPEAPQWPGLQAPHSAPH